MFFFTQPFILGVLQPGCYRKICGIVYLLSWSYTTIGCDSYLFLSFYGEMDRSLSEFIFMIF
jgi:hypothetical protein